MSNRKAVFIIGPTASGKTALAVEMALRINGEIINADSMQIYQQLDIGSAKPDERERRGISHHLLDILSLGEDFSVAAYQTMAFAAMEDICARGKLPIVCGGTGLYINALTQKMDFTAIKGDPALRQKLLDFAKNQGPLALHQQLQEKDAETAARLHPNDTKRIVRALEVFELTGKPFSQQTEAFGQRPPADYPLSMIGIRWQRENLNRRIDARVEAMMEKGLYKEALNLHKTGISTGHPSMMGLGYRQLYAGFEGGIEPSETVETIKRETRRYAKRQMTWFQKDLRIHWLQGENYDPIGLADAAQAYIEHDLG